VRRNRDVVNSKPLPAMNPYVTKSPDTIPTKLRTTWRKVKAAVDSPQIMATSM
jgi:hypothetical protein